MPGTIAAISESTGLAVPTVWRWVQDMAKSGEVHIGGWYCPPGGGPLAGVYHAGPGVTAKMPRLSTTRERSRKYRRRMRASGDWEDVKARERSKYHAARPVRRDPLTAAFFGPARG